MTLIFGSNAKLVGGRGDGDRGIGRADAAVHNDIRVRNQSVVITGIGGVSQAADRRVVISNRERNRNVLCLRAYSSPATR